MNINLKSWSILILLCVLWTHNGICQYYNKIYIADDLNRSTIWQVKPDSNEVFISLEKTCSDGFLCTNASRVDKYGDIDFSKEIIGYRGFFNNFQLRNDTLFFFDTEFNVNDSTFYWKLGLMKTNGEMIGEYKFPTLHISDVAIGRFGYLYPHAYGLTLVNNSEVILWGEGLDNKTPNPNNVPFRAIFLRVGLDGKQRDDIFWFEKNEFRVRRMADGCRDIDGNMVFFYEWLKPIEGTNEFEYRRSIFKVQPDNDIIEIAEIPCTASEIGIPRIAVDSEGNYFVNPIYADGSAPGYNKVSKRNVGFISKVNRLGEVLWTSIVPPFNHSWHEPYEATHTSTIYRISTTKNGDVLCTGRVFVRDSFDIVGEDKKYYSTGDGSFIARFDTDGNLLWRHFIIPHKKDGSIRRNVIVDIQEASDGSIFTSGDIERDGDVPSVINDAWLMRLTPDGCLTEDCSHIGKYFDFPGEIVSTSDNTVDTKLTIYPNPGKAKIHVEVPSDFALPVLYQITDVQGRIRETGEQSDSNMSLDMSFLSSGLYFITVQDRRGRVISGKWIKE